MTKTNFASLKTSHRVGVAIGVAAFVVAVTIANAASAAPSCDTLKQDIAANGYVIYHYTDPKQPDLPLFRRYVKDSSECGTGKMAQLRPLPQDQDPNCDLPRCIEPFGEQNQ